MKISKQQYKQLVKLLLKLSRYDINRLQTISRQQFGRKTNTLNSIFKQGRCSYRQVKNDAFSQLVKTGAKNPLNMCLTNGRYLVVSDSHGKHTSRGMFRLLNNLNNNLNFNAIIHIGHILDDDNDISYLWKDFKNFIVVAREQEIRQVQKRKSEYNYQVINGYIDVFGNRICNQEVVKDYSKTGLNVIDTFIYPFNCVFSGHKHELMSFGNLHQSIQYYTPGCVCDPHITTTVKQIDFKDGRQIKQSYPSTFQIYRNRRNLLNYWEQGVVIIQAVDGIVTINPIRIKNIKGQYVTSYFDKIYTQTQVKQPDKKIFFNSDIHVDNHDEVCLDVQDKFVNTYKPDVYVNLGDTLNNKSINHHEMQNGYFIQKDFLKEYNSFCNLMKETSEWAEEKHIVFGNHQRFMNDFTNKFPQLKTLFDKMYSEPIEQFGFIQHGLKSIFEIDGVKFLHGDLRIYGNSGTFLQKLSKTFGKDTIVGHLHVNEIKRGSYIVGLSGKYNQQYNDVNGSRWQQGFGFTNCYNGVSFTQLVSVNRNGTVLLDGILYIGQKKEKREAEVRIVVE